MSIPNQPADIAILGGGPGGYVAALSAAQRGISVTLVEKNRVGGTCLNVGCIPTKVLTTATELLLRSKRACEFGLSIPQAEVDLPGLMNYKRSTVDQLVGGIEQLLKARRVTLVRGVGRIIRPDMLLVDDGQGGKQEVLAKQIILAPGSITAVPPIPGLNLPGVVTSTGALDIDVVPASLIVIGGGVIGLEFACIYEALGSKVTVLEMAASILPVGTDEVIAKRLQIILRRRGMSIQTGVTVERIEKTAETLQVCATGAGGKQVFQGERVLVATGRWPNTQAMGFDEIGLHMNGPAIAVDDRLATNLPNVWAIGDAVGGWMLAHKAMVDGRVAAENATGGQRQIDYRSVPNVIFTRPEVASVGLTEAQARSESAEVKVSQFPFSANPRGRILGETDGLVRLVCEARTGRILGAHLMGPHATDLIAEAALAVQIGATADDLAWTTHAHPTLPEAMLEAALGCRGAAIHMQSRCGDMMPEYLETTLDKFIFRVATDRLYAPEGVWALREGDQVRVGLTDYQQQLNGDVAFVHLKPAGTKFTAGDELAEMETIKATVSFLSPVSGTLVEVNSDLDLGPEVVNQDPYGKGWLVVIDPAQWEADRTKLMDARAYLELMRSQAEQELKK